MESEEYTYNTTCLMCSRHIDGGASYTVIHRHLDICHGPIVITVLRKEDKIKGIMPDSQDAERWLSPYTFVYKGKVYRIMEDGRCTGVWKVIT